MTPRDRLNVDDFGAKGDGRADDTGAIQKALDAAGNMQGTVMVPQGTFLSLRTQVRSLQERLWR